MSHTMKLKIKTLSLLNLINFTVNKIHQETKKKLRKKNVLNSPNLIKFLNKLNQKERDNFYFF
jgi:hypothetical protein